MRLAIAAPLTLTLFAVAALVGVNDLARAAATQSAVSVTATPNDAIHGEYRQLLIADDEALDEIDTWIREEEKLRKEGVEFSGVTLRLRIRERLKKVAAAYDSFLERHPEHVEARLAFGSFLMDTEQEERALEQILKARELAPDNPAVWNNLAGYFARKGPLRKALEYYAKASELVPNEPTYSRNLANVILLFRREAAQEYRLTEEQVIRRSIRLLEKAVALDPGNFLLATEYARAFYAIASHSKPESTSWTEPALRAWSKALDLAEDDVQRQGVRMHLAQVYIAANRLEEARRQLDLISSPEQEPMKQELLQQLATKAG